MGDCIKERIDEKMDDYHEDKINVRRSDGIHLDTTGIARQVLLESTKESKDIKHHDEHLNIRLHRSDGHEKDLKASLKGVLPQVDSGSGKLSRSSLVAHPTHVKILHLSDTLDQFNRSSISQLPSADVFVHTGNFTVNGTDEELNQFNDLLETCKKRYRTIIILPGTNEIKNSNKIEDIRNKLTNASHVLHNSSCEVFDINFYGLYVGKPAKVEAGIPTKIDILLSNTAAMGRLDVVNISHTSDAKSKVHGGDSSVLEFIKRYLPSLHLHGAFYISRGYLDKWANFPLSVNSCMHGSTGKLINGPYVIEANAVTRNVSSVLSSVSSSVASKWDFEIGSIY